MITISGRDITRENNEFPSLHDVGYSLSRVPRFNGYTTEKWTNLHHLIGCHDYARASSYGTRIEFYALTHDAHEAVTGDQSPPWKTDETRELQRQLDLRFYTSLGIGLPDGFTARIVKAIDSQMVYAEAKAYAPQVAEHILKPGPNFRDGINTVDPFSDRAVQYAKAYLDPFIEDPNVCGIIYREMVSQALWAINVEKAHADS